MNPSRHNVKCAAIDRLLMQGEQLLQAKIHSLVVFSICRTTRIPFTVFLLHRPCSSNQQWSFARCRWEANPESSMDPHTQLLEDCTRLLAKMVTVAPVEQHRIQYRGYFAVPFAPEEVCVFFDVSDTSAAQTMHLQVPGPEVAWVLPDEIVNHRHHRGTRISTRTVHLVTKHIGWCLLQDAETGAMLESPSLLYARVPHSMVMWTRMCGHLVQSGMFGRHYYFTDWEGVAENEAEPEEEKEKEKRVIVAFACFPGRTRVVEDSDPLPKQLELPYDSVLTGRRPVTLLVVRDRWRHVVVG